MDTDALIDGWRELYQPRFMPTLWEHLISLAQLSHLAIPDAVILELERKDDELYKWCKSNEDVLSIESNGQIQSAVKELVIKYPQFAWSGFPKSKNFADPFVFASARVNNCSVVTHERATGNMSGPKLPDICRAEFISCLRFHDVIVQEGWIFR